jgi:NDP-sugar pyrophosphorylase family protein
MSFEKSIREDFSDIPVLFFLGGEGTRMEDLAYKHVLPSKQWLPIGFDENNEPIPLFWRNFEILFELGFREFYILVNKDEEKIKKYFEKKIRGPNVNILPLNKENISERVKVEGLNIYIFKQKEKGTGNALIEIKEAIGKRQFLEVFPDEYFGGEKEKIKKEIKSFIDYSIQKIEETGAIKVFALVDKKIAIGSIWRGLTLQENGRVIQLNNGDFVTTSICLSSSEFFNILISKRSNLKVLDVASPQILSEIVELQKAYGKIIKIDFFSNINTPKDYFTLVSYIKEYTAQKKNNSKLSSQF